MLHPCCVQQLSKALATNSFCELQVLGTLITEWDDGPLGCMQMFISPQSAR